MNSSLTSILCHPSTVQNITEETGASDSKMISHTDTTLSSTTTASNHNHHRLPSPRSPNSADLVGHKGSAKGTAKSTSGSNDITTNSGNSKKRKRYDENIIDGFAIVSFKTWEDLQDEVNGKAATSTNHVSSGSTNNTSTRNHNTEYTADSKVSKPTSSKPSSSKSKSSASSSCTSSTSVNPKASQSSATSSNNESSKKKDKSSSSKKTAGQSQAKESTKEQNNKRNKTTSSGTLDQQVKKAIEAKEIAEKRLIILREKLDQEQSKNRSNNHNDNDNASSGDNKSINNDNHNGNKDMKNLNIPDQSFPQKPPMHNISDTADKSSQHTNHNNTSGKKNSASTNNGLVNNRDHTTMDSNQNEHHPTFKEEHQAKTNSLYGQHLLKDPGTPTKHAPYAPYHLHPQFQRQDSVIHQTIQIHAPMPPSISPTRYLHQNPMPTTPLQQQFQQQKPIPTSIHNQSQARSSPLTTSHLHQPTPQSSHTTSLNSLNPHAQYLRPHSIPTAPQLHPHLMHHPSTAQHVPPLSSFPHPPPPPAPSSMIQSSMSLASLPSLYGCPPSIYITDTISRQTSIIPPMAPTTLDQSNPSVGARFGQSSVMHPLAPPYAPHVPPHHSMYYPTSSTERSFIEYARTYTGPGQLGYPSLMNSYPSAPPSLTANSYSFDRWPRTALDQQRTVRFNSIYPSTLPDRTYASYASSARPPFPAGLFPPF